MAPIHYMFLALATLLTSTLSAPLPIPQPIIGSLSFGSSEAGYSLEHDKRDIEIITRKLIGGSDACFGSSANECSLDQDKRDVEIITRKLIGGGDACFGSSENECSLEQDKRDVEIITREPKPEPTRGQNLNWA